MIDQIIAEEIKKGVPENHRTQLRGTGKTQFSASLVHGLYNSPQDMNDLANYFESKNINVLSSRLDGHYEADTEILKSKVRWQTWLEQTRTQLAIAKQIGEKVILVGHSTGALTHTWLAIENPESIAGLVWFSPAFKVQKHSRRGVELLKHLNITFKTPEGRTISGHAGVEVNEMIEAFEKMKPQARLRLEKIPIWMANTRADLVIDVKVAQEFFESLKGAKRQAYLQPIHEFVSHDSIALKVNRSFTEMMASMAKFLEF